MEQETEIKTSGATTHLNIWTNCPYCNTVQDQTERLVSHLDAGELRAESCDAEIKCEKCNKLFIVNIIEY